MFLRWIPYQDTGSFDDFKKLLMLGGAIEEKDNEEILQDVKDIITLFNKGRG
ncbi:MULTISPECIES: hypothetical protein [unclassified Sedimentibacter]|uniref:hypothetical protein n=1 Tax=unclassified Sedimentibacter TaxID=2649220 RepID=UPI0027E16A3B|nr:hypothetical protein [Sedimentibacter sp. MB35-C1]WMJ78483.1 hypothetical protein RBQ61_06060 [Sedimentibacter sp. MB35-C1]